VKLDAAFEITGWEQDDYDHGRVALDYELG
jgi:hypothetical protein